MCQWTGNSGRRRSRPLPPCKRIRIHFKLLAFDRLRAKIAHEELFREKFRPIIPRARRWPGAFSIKPCCPCYPRKLSRGRHELTMWGRGPRQTGSAPSGTHLWVGKLWFPSVFIEVHETALLGFGSSRLCQSCWCGFDPFVVQPHFAVLSRYRAKPIPKPCVFLCFMLALCSHWRSRHQASLLGLATASLMGGEPSFFF
jgi:hypothetical protein